MRRSIGILIAAAVAAGLAGAAIAATGGAAKNAPKKAAATASASIVPPGMIAINKRDRPLPAKRAQSGHPEPDGV
jgi:hypothetical protein